MNRTFLHYMLLIVILISLVMVVRTGFSLWEMHRVNNFIKNDSSQYEKIPVHVKAQFSQAYKDVKQGHSREALERLITITDDNILKAAAYYNRANIYLNMAKTTDEDDARFASVALAKQDYRKSLLLDPSNRGARFNLELALLMVPENPVDNSKSDSKKIIMSKAIRAVGFKVDLP